MSDISGDLSDSRLLMLLRHAKAESGDGSDHERGLTDKGKRQAAAIGAHLAETGLVPDLVLVSPAERAQQTYALVAHAFDEAGREAPVEVRVIDELYDSSPEMVVEVIGENVAEKIRVLIVGHEPTMSMTANLLANDDSDSAAAAQVRIGVPTASLCLLQPEQGWTSLGEESARLVGVFTPG